MTDNQTNYYYTTEQEAQAFLSEWPDGWEIDVEKANNYVIPAGDEANGNTESLLGLFGKAISEFKQVVSNSNIQQKYLMKIMTQEQVVANIIALKNSSALLINMKTQLEVIGALKRKSSPYKRIEALEAQLTEEMKKKEEAEKRSNEYAAKATHFESELAKKSLELDTLDKFYFNLKARATEVMGSRWVEEAIASGAISESEVEEVDEDGEK